MGNNRPPESNDKIPASGDLAGWKQVDRRLHDRFAACFDREGLLWSPRAIKRYFGDEDIEYYFMEHQQRGVAPAYADWGALHYRPTKSSKTFAEKLLAAGLPEAEAILLKARLVAYPSLYRVTRHASNAGTIDLEDVLLGGIVTVHDKMMSGCMEDGLFLSARVFPAGGFHFLDMSGPPLGRGMGTDAVEFLRQEGMEFTPEGLRYSAHLFGWLWGWMDDWQDRFRNVQLRNMDGDELLWHTASFSVVNMPATRQALLAREDIESQEDEFHWMARTGKAADQMHGPVHLGRLELVGDELVLTVNSANRLGRARQWLDKLPGVTFRSVSTRPWNESAEDQPLDERIAEHEEVEMTPELASSVQQMMDQRFMGWLDTPLPILSGKTPRQACKTPAGRQQVTMMIRTMPEPMGPAPVRVPRQAMLAELGLEDSTEVAASFRQSSPTGSIVSGRIGRNDPCPCGGGKKYKKCCGR